MTLTSTLRKNFPPAAVTLVVAAAYLSVLPARLTNANNGIDGGDFLAAMLTGGIPHPTGYPTYALLGWLIQQLPGQLLPGMNPYSRALLLSWLPAAVASGLLTLWVARVTDTRSRGAWLAAILAGLAWGLSPIVWSQAEIVEVHGLQSLFIIIALWWVTELVLWDGAPSSFGRLLAMAGLVGFGLGNHVTLVLFGPACLFGLWYAWKHGLALQRVLAQAGMTLLGLMVYLYLPLRALAYPAINWGNPQTLSGFWWLISGKPYQGLLFDLPAAQMAQRVAALAGLLRSQFGILGLIAVVIGAMQYKFSRQPVGWVLLWIMAAYSLFSIGYATDDSTGYLVAVVLVVSIWFAVSIQVVLELTYRNIPIGIGLVVLFVASLAWQFPITRHQVDGRANDQPARFAEMVMQTAPDHAIILTSYELDSFPLWYYHFGLHQRSDLAIVVLPLTQFVWYQQTLAHTYPALKLPDIQKTDTKSASWGGMIPQLNPGRPVCSSQKDSSLPYPVNFLCLKK